MDIARAVWLHGCVKSSHAVAASGGLKHLLPLAALLCSLAGCTTPAGTPEPGKVASLQVQVPSREASPDNKEIACQIQMIDGVMVASSDRLRPGHHRLIVALGTQEGEHTGDVDLVIPHAKSYRLRAERDKEAFTLSLIEVETSKIVATSTAQAGQVMQFQVFVIQK